MPPFIKANGKDPVTPVKFQFRPVQGPGSLDASITEEVANDFLALSICSRQRTSGAYRDGSRIIMSAVALAV